MKVRISSDFLKLLDFEAILPVIKNLEIIEIYQYDLHSFFSLQRIYFKTGQAPVFKAIMEKISVIEIFQVLEERNEEMLCVIKQHVKQGFWPDLLRREDFGIIPPIQMDPDYIKATIIINENIADQLETLSKMIKSFEILANTSVQTQIDKSARPLPRFTERQREIATYAIRNGFYESPKKITAEAIAQNFDISVSAMNEHLRKTEKIAMKYFFA